MKNEVLVKKDVEIEQSVELAKRYSVLLVRTNAEMIVASDNLKFVKSQFKMYDDREKEMTRPINEAKKSCIDLFRPVKTALVNAEAWLKNQISCYQYEQQRIADEINRKAQAIADKKAQDLRAKAEAELKAGNIEKAEKLQAKAEEKATFVPTVKADIPKIAGQSTRTLWYYKVIDIELVPRKYMIENDELLSDIASSSKGTLEIAGIKFYSEKSLSSSGK